MKKLRMHLRDGNVIEMDAPDDVNLGLMGLQIRNSGYFATNMIYVPESNIGLLLVLADGQAPVEVKPAGSTLQ